MYHSPTTVVFLRKNTFKGCGEEEEEKLTFYLLTIAIMQVNKLYGKRFRSAWALNASRYILFAHANDNKCIITLLRERRDRREMKEELQRKNIFCQMQLNGKKTDYIQLFTYSVK